MVWCRACRACRLKTGQGDRDEGNVEGRRKESYVLRPCKVMKVIGTKFPWGYENDDKRDWTVRSISGLHSPSAEANSCIAVSSSPKKIDPISHDVRDIMWKIG